MELSRSLLAAFCLCASQLAVEGAAIGLRLKVTAHNMLHEGLQQNTSLTLQAQEALESLQRMAKNTTKSAENGAVKALEEQVAKLEKSVSENLALDRKKKAEQKKEHEKEANSTKVHDELMDKVNKWGERTRRASRLSAMKAISKIKNAIHLIKKGALTGNKDASAKLKGLLSKMGEMA